MKKILTLFAVVGMIAFSSCEGPEGPPGRDGQDGLSANAFELKNVNLGRVSDNEYSLSSNFQSIGGNLYDDEVVLIFRKTGQIDGNTPIWQSIPRTIYFSNGDELDYDFDFSKVDFLISANSTFNLANTPEYTNGQTFRIVVVPSNLSASVNKANYTEVMKSMNIEESQIKNLN